MVCAQNIQASCMVAIRCGRPEAANPEPSAVGIVPIRTRRRRGPSSMDAVEVMSGSAARLGPAIAAAIVCGPA